MSAKNGGIRLNIKAQMKTRHTLRIAAAGVVAFVVVAGGGMYAYAKSLEGRIVPGVVVAGIPLGGLTESEATNALTNGVKSYGTNGISVRIGTTVLHPALKEVGVSVDIPSTVARALQAGRLHLLPSAFAVPSFAAANIPLTVLFDASAYQQYLAALRKGFSYSAINPTIKVVGGAVTVVHGQDGRVVLGGSKGQDLLRAVEHLAAWDETLPVAAQHPTVAADELEDARTRMEAMFATPLTVAAGGKQFRVTRDQLASWLELKYAEDKVVQRVADGYEYSLNDEAFRPFVDSINAAVGKPAIPAEGYKAEVAGVYAYEHFKGSGIDPAQAGQALLAAVKEGKQEVEFSIGAIMPSITYRTIVAPIAAGKVVEVNIGRQELYAFQDGVLKFWTHVSTGLRNSTKAGRWHVYNKTPIQRMVGQGYNLPNVKWVMPYDGDFTLHTAYWHHDFGKPKSHGCTNMFEADAHWLYDFVEIGTPVVVVENT